MWLQRTLLGMVVFLAAGTAATVHAQASLRWRGADYGMGLQADSARFRVNVQAGPVETYPLDHLLGASQSTGLNVKLVGKAGWFSDVGVYGRMGNLTSRSLLGAGPDTTTMGYGVGVSWDLSPRATASVGWDTYDVRGASDIRGTSLGLRWRY